MRHRFFFHAFATLTTIQPSIFQLPSGRISQATLVAIYFRSWVWERERYLSELQAILWPFQPYLSGRTQVIFLLFLYTGRG
jgi:hypothetical protein